MIGPAALRGGGRLHATAAALLALMLITSLATLAPATAHAGSYVVSTCLAAPNGENNAWTPSASSGHVTAYGSACDNITASGLTARTAVDPGGTTAPFLDNATWTFDAPAGSVITQAELSAFAYRYGSGSGFAPESWATGLSDETGGYIWGSGGLAPMWTGTSPGSYITVPVPSRTHLQFGVVCGNLGGCLTASTGVYSPPVVYMRALTQMYGSRITVTDGTTPSISGQRGSLYTTSGWLGGTAAVGFDAADNVGVRTTRATVDGDVHNSDSSCDYTRRVPCPAAPSFDTSFNTAAFADGDHALTLTAIDTAGNPLSVARTVHIDNTAPGMPATPALQGAPSSQWRTTNGFTVTYANPSAGGGSPAASSDVQVCPIDLQGQILTTGCTTAGFATASGANTFTVPSAGQFRARVRVHDALYTGAWSDWSAVLRFDDVVPAAAQTQHFNGWISQAERQAGLAINPPAQLPAPASGIAGYAITRDGTLPGSSVDVPASSGFGGSGTLSLNSWADGVYTVRVRAVTEAGLSSADANVQSTTVKIDTHPPTIGVADAPDPGATIAREVRLAIAATDDLSGMDPAPEDKPVANGGYIEYTVDGGSPTRVRGSTASLATSDGHHVVTVSASDVAGNHATDRTFTFTQDTTPPHGGMLAVDQSQPRRIAFLVDEECIKSASIQISTDTTTWQPIDTTIDGRTVSGQVPDEVWDTRRPYTVRALVTDCAGNQATLTTRTGGPEEGHPIGMITPPAREATRLSLAFGRLPATAPCPHKRHRATKKRTTPKKAAACPAARSAAIISAKRKIVSRTRAVSGTLVDSSGRPLAGREVQLQTQPRTLTSRWTVVRVLTTDAHGHVAGLVRKFTSLRIRLVKPREETYEAAESNKLVTQVAAVSTIHAAPRRLHNGQIVVFRGRLMGGSVPKTGLTLSLYGFSPTKREWLPVRTTVHTDALGHWVARYRFTATRTSVTYRFRMRIPARPDYPFATGWSRRIAVGVTP